MNWKEIVGETWYELIGNFLESDKMHFIISEINRERKLYTVYPEKHEFHKMFRIFKELDPHNIKCVIIGLDPYPDGSGDGLAFSNSTKLDRQISPSLKNILKEIEQTNTEKEKINLFPQDLTRWVQQGVFLVNSYLTVRKEFPGLHGFWDLFTKEWIHQLCVYNDIIWLLFGRIAHGYEKCIDNKNHFIIKTSHPSPLSVSYNTDKIPAFLGSRCFETTNDLLDLLNKPQIKW